MGLPITTWLFLSAVAVMQMRLIRASPSSSTTTTSQTPIYTLTESDLYSIPLISAAQRQASQVIYSSSLDNELHSVQEHTCTALLRYRSNNFLYQTQSAINLLNRVSFQNNNYINIKIIKQEQSLQRPFVEKATWRESYQFNAPNDSSDKYCVVIQEIPDLIDDKLGVASECGYCSQHRNVAYVSEAVDDSLTFAVILHELSHLFCASHTSDGVMHHIVKEGSILSGVSVQELYNGFVNTNWGGPTCMSTVNVSAHTRECYGDCNYYYEEEETGSGAAFVWLFFVLLLLPIIWFWSIWWWDT